MTAVSLSRTQARLASWQRSSGTLRVVIYVTVFSVVVSVTVCYTVLVLVYGSLGEMVAAVGASGVLLPAVAPLFIAPAVTRQLTSALHLATTVIGELEESKRELEYLANHDPLTSLLNRRGFFTAIAELDPTTFSALLVATADVDKFKSVNDTYGHATGDAVLTRVADALRSAAGPTAIVGRLGGDEFAAVLPDGDRHVNGIRESLRSLVVPELEEVGLKVQCSVGVALHTPGTAIDATMADADRALYQDKHGDTDRHPPARQSIAQT